MIGCAASHHSLWKEAETTQSNLLVFEARRILPARHSRSNTRPLLSSLPDWDIILVGSQHQCRFGLQHFLSILTLRDSSRTDTLLMNSFRRSRKIPDVSSLFASIMQWVRVPIGVSPQGARKVHLSDFPWTIVSFSYPAIRQEAERHTFR